MCSVRRDAGGRSLQVMNQSQSLDGVGGVQLRSFGPMNAGKIAWPWHSHPIT